MMADSGFFLDERWKFSEYAKRGGDVRLPELEWQHLWAKDIPTLRPNRRPDAESPQDNAWLENFASNMENN